MKILFYLILETVRQAFPAVTEDEVGIFIANWSRHAKQRRGAEK